MNTSTHAHQQPHDHETAQASPAAQDQQHGHDTDHSGHEIMFRNRFWVSLVLTIPVLLFSPTIQAWFGFNMPEFRGSDLIGAFFSIIIFAYGGVPFLRMAIPEIQDRTPGMMTLISLAITVAFAYSLFALVTATGRSFFWEMATLIVVMLFGHWMEMRSVRRASGALDELAKLMPDTAERVLDDGSIEDVPVTQLRPDDVVMVRPGASVPADGEIIEGHSQLNEAMMTGESKPIKKAKGDQVIGGTLNHEGSFRLRVSATGDDTALAGMMKLVEDAQKSKSRTQVLADQAASWLFYVAVSVAAITAVAWIIAIGFDIAVIERVATVLVIACPHALGLAIPLVVAISTAMGAQQGILVRDRLALEAARQIDVVIFDKTGTLTEGQFGVTDMQSIESWQDDQVLALARALEGDSEHPIGRGIREKADEKGIEPLEIRDFEAIKGRGIKAVHQDERVYIGGPRLLEMLELQLPGSLPNPSPKPLDLSMGM